MRADNDLYLQFDGYDDLKPLLSESDEDVLVELGKPALIRIPGTDATPRARLVSALLHGNEDSGYRAVLDVLRDGARYPFDLWVLIGNVRAAHQMGWFAHRFLDDQEDFNRVWQLGAPTTRMRRCADAILEVMAATDLEAAVDMHNNTGVNPYYAITPDPTEAAVALAGTLAGTILRWPLRANTLMEALSPICPAISLECGLPGIAANHVFATEALRQFLAMPQFDDTAHADRFGRVPTFEMRHRVTVRREVPFAFGGLLTDDLDLVLHPGLDGFNFGMLLAGTELGRVHPGAAMPLVCTDMRGRETTDQYFSVNPAGGLVVTQDVTPVMFVTTVQQTRRDCLFYVSRRRA